MNISRLLSWTIVTVVLCLCAPRRGLAFDDEPNDTCASAEATEATFYGQGDLSSSDTQDSYENFNVPGALSITLTNLSNSDDDFEIELFDSSSTSVANATSSSGVAELSYTVTAPGVFCLAVTGSEGAYRLLSDLLADPPVISDIQDSGSNSITSASIGDTVTIVGTHLGTSASQTEVTFGGVYGSVASISPTAIDVVVPENAVNGDVYVLRGDRRSSAVSFGVGVSTFAASSATAPDPSWLNSSVGPRVYLNRTLVTFDAGADSSDVNAALDSVLALDSNRDSWTQVGFSPYRNAYQIEWAWISSHTPTIADTASLLTDLVAESDVDGVDPEYPVSDFGIEVPIDYDLFHDAGSDRGAFAQIGLEESRRLFRYSALGGMSSDPGVVLIDTGLRYGTSTWDSGTECRTGTGSGGSTAEFPTDYFGLVEHSSGAWSTTSAPGHFTRLTGPTQVHGNTMAGIIGARSQGDPDWADGEARDSSGTAINANGVLAAFELQGIDDDGDSSTDLDDLGESIDYEVLVINGRSQAGSPTPETNWLLWEAFEEVATNADYDDKVVVIASGYPSRFGAAFSGYRHDKLIKALCRDRIIVTAAGNGDAEIGVGAGVSCLGGSSGNAVASDFACYCPEHSIVVGGTEAGGNGSGTDTRQSYAGPPGITANYGAAVDLLAPASAYTVATVCQSGGLSDGYFEGMLGTSPGAALVGATVALVRGIVDSSTLSDAAVVQLVESSVDDVSSLYTESGSQGRLDLFEAVMNGIQLAGGLPDDMRGTVRLYATDYANDALVAQDFEDLQTGTFAASSTVDSVIVTADGCYGPTDVEVHPRGDVVYVLCSDSGEVAAYAADDLDFVGSISLDGGTVSYGELEITPDGILRVPTIDASGELTLESFDTYSGSKHLDAETLYSSATLADAYAIHATQDGAELAVVASDGSSSSDDYDVLSNVAPNPVDKTASTVTNDDLTSTSGTYMARDVTWRGDDSSAVAVFYGDNSGGDVETYESDWGSVTSDATIDYCEDVVSISMNPTGDDDYAYVSCQDNGHFAVVDLASVSSSYSPDFYLYGASTAASSVDYTPTVVDFATNGRFIYGGFQYTGGGSSWSWVITAEHDAVLSSGSSDIFFTSYDIMGYAGFDKPRGMDMTPLMSAMSPRPGSSVSGVRTLWVVVRDPEVVEVDFFEGTTSLCTDSDVLDGIAECAIDFSSWSSGDYVVEVEATTDAADQYRIYVPYTVP